MNLCTNCLKNKNYHSKDERITCLEEVVDKLLNTLENSEIIESENNRETNYKIKILEHGHHTTWRYLQ